MDPAFMAAASPPSHCPENMAPPPLAPSPAPSEELIEWDPTPPPHAALGSPSPQKPVSDSQKRLAAIRMALQDPSSNPDLVKADKRRREEDPSAGEKKRSKANSPPHRDSDISFSSSSGSDPTTAIVPTQFKGGKSGGSAPVFLSQEQVHIRDIVLSGQNVFFTGSAGTGKSVLLREIIKALRRKHGKNLDQVAVTASTGIAACNVGGTTLHSFAGITSQDKPPNELIRQVRWNRSAASRWVRTKVLIIDEVSMIDGRFFDKLSYVAKTLRKDRTPFGGLQLVVTGDFFQLPPVSKDGQSIFCFEADAWREAMKHTYGLTQVFRQRDQRFITMLNEMRFGNLSPESIAAFSALSRPLKYDDGVEPTELFPTRWQVDEANHRRLQALSGEIEIYRAVDTGGASLETRKRMLDDMMAPLVLELRIGAQVMLIKNMDEMLVNGSIGRVTRFLADHRGDKPKWGRPLQRYPVVDFAAPGGRHRQVLMVADTFKVEAPNGKLQACRKQVPLILAWAMSIHKSQGQTLDRVRVDLGRTFEKGQAYVALSRATSMEGLQILRFKPEKVQAHPTAIKWNEGLKTIGKPAPKKR